MLKDATTTAITVPGIQTILEKSYGVNKEGYYPQNQKLAEKILQTVETTDPERIENKVMLLIWNNYSGGDLASSVANEIVETFSLV